MPHITLTEEQAALLAQTKQGLEVRDPHGRTVGFLNPFEIDLPALIEECKRQRAAPGPRVTSAQIQAHFRRLEEIERDEGLDREKMLDLLRRMRAGEQI